VKELTFFVRLPIPKLELVLPVIKDMPCQMVTVFWVLQLMLTVNNTQTILKNLAKHVTIIITRNWEFVPNSTIYVMVPIPILVLAWLAIKVTFYSMEIVWLLNNPLFLLKLTLIVLNLKTTDVPNAHQAFT